MEVTFILAQTHLRVIEKLLLFRLVFCQDSLVRITFTFVEKDADAVDYEDYH
jgi:hypothetical protein